MEEKEIFKDIPSFEGIYQVSNFGNVKSCSRFLKNGRFQNEFIMKQQINKKGYKTITFYKEGKNVHFTVHKLVAMMFVPNPFDKPQVDHIDCNKGNNRFDNLRWCTNSENIGYCVQNGGRYIPHPEESKCSRMVAKLDLEGNEICVYPSLGEAHRKNPKASVSKISAVCRGERNQTAGFKWEFRSDGLDSFKKVQHNGIPIPIEQLDEKYDHIAFFDSIKDCERLTKTHETCIRKSLKEGVKTWNGFYFRYKD